MAAESGERNTDADVSRLEAILEEQSSVVHGVQPRPRLLVWGTYNKYAELVEGLFPTVKAVAELGTVDQTEFDALLTTSSAEGSSHHLYTIVLDGCGVRPHLNARPLAKTPPIHITSWTVSKHLYTSKDLPDEIRELLPGLIERLRQQNGNQFFDWNTSGMSLDARNKLPELRRIMDRFIWTKHGQLLAGRFDRVGGKSECWCLPALEPEEVRPWVQAALRVWRRRDPDVFPTHHDWDITSEWMTPEQDAIVDQSTANEEARRQALERYGATATTLNAQFEKATHEANVGPRRLLSEKGTDLVAAAEEALSVLGFATTNMDAKQSEGNKVEDLRVEDPSVSGWTALTEVKGYPGGVKSNDLLLFNKWVGPFAVAEKRPPSACWLVANQFAGDNPSHRPPALASKEDELRTFAEASNGLIIDTAELFRLWKSVVTGETSKQDARRLLREARGRFTFTKPKSD